jgi:hypothetical protein
MYVTTFLLVSVSVTVKTLWNAIMILSYSFIEADSSVGFEVLTAVIVQSTILRNATL